jgi:taurine dioxygenase
MVRGVGTFAGVQVTPLTGVLGAEVAVGDVRDLDDDGLARLRSLVCEYLVVVMRGQSLTASEQVAFSHRFGPAGESPFIEPSPDHPEVIKVLKEADDGDAFNFGGAWHSDFSFLPNPPAFTILHAIDVPPWGGDTLWCSQVAAHDALDDTTLASLRSVWGVHTARDAYSPRMQPLHDGLSAMTIRCDDRANDTRKHPLITTHPETGRDVLFYNRGYVRDLDGVPEGHVGDTLSWLHAHCTEPRFTCRHRWRAGDLVIWDNRSTQHYALNDYAGFRRELHRTTVAGGTPVSRHLAAGTAT